MKHDPNLDEVLDGMALWDEHKPQTGEDWLAVARRIIAAGETTENSSPLFAAVVLAVQQHEAAEEALVKERETERAVQDELADELRTAQAQHDALYLAVEEEVERLRDLAAQAYEAEEDHKRRNAMDTAASLHIRGRAREQAAQGLEAILDAAGEKREVPDYGEAVELLTGIAEATVSDRPGALQYAFDGAREMARMALAALGSEQKEKP